MSFKKKSSEEYYHDIQSSLEGEKKGSKDSPVENVSPQKPNILRYPFESIALPDIAEPNTLCVDVEGIFFEQPEGSIPNFV